MVHPARAYQRMRITTASASEMVVLLFEGLVRFTGAAAEAIDENRWADAGVYLTSAVEIVSHLHESLSPEVAPAVVATLARTYSLWALCLARAQVARDAARVRELVPQMQGLLESFRGALHLEVEPASVAVAQRRAS